MQTVPDTTGVEEGVRHSAPSSFEINSPQQQTAASYIRPQTISEMQKPFNALTHHLRPKWIRIESPLAYAAQTRAKKDRLRPHGNVRRHGAERL